MYQFVQGSAFWIILFLYIVSVTASGYDVTYINGVKYVRNYRLQTGVFRIFDTSSYTNCVRECVLRQHCRAMTFHLSELYCHLGSVLNDLEMTSDDDVITSHPTDWTPPQSLVGNCTNHNCVTGQRCTELSSGVTKCMYTECPDPPGTLSVTSSVRAVGSTISSTDTTTQTTANITCMTNSTWTSHVVTCPSTFQMVDAYCIKLVDSPEMTPDDGEALCGTLGGRLIWMTSVEMYDVIVAVIDGGRYFLAGRDDVTEGTWKLPNGEEMTWLHSRAGDIDTANDDCLTYDDGPGTLKDLPCSHTKRIICEFV